VAERREPKQALLVDVAEDPEDWLALADPGEAGTDPVAAQLGEGGGPAPGNGGRLLEAGGAGNLQQLFEQGGNLRSSHSTTCNGASSRARTAPRKRAASAP
jgi:hypothetical protein